MPPKEPWRSNMQDIQESRGRTAREARSARRAADAAVIHGREQWVQAGQPSSGPEQQSMQPGSQRWRKLKELEETVDRRQQLMAEQAEQQRQQFFIRQQHVQQEEEQLANLKHLLVQQQQMLSQQSQTLHGYAWNLQAKEMLLEERATAEIGFLQGTSSSSAAEVPKTEVKHEATSSPSAMAAPVQSYPEPAFVETTYEPVTAVVEVAAEHVDIEVDLGKDRKLQKITDDFRAHFTGFTLDFQKLKTPPMIVVLQLGIPLELKGALVGDVVVAIAHPAGYLLHEAKSIDEAALYICEATSMTVRRRVSPPAVNDPRNKSGKLRVLEYRKPVLPYPAYYP